MRSLVILQGFLAICAFGLPGRSHEDGPARGVLAALAIVETFKVCLHAASFCAEGGMLGRHRPLQQVDTSCV